jgi:phenylacetate-CoA ligase
MRVAATRLLLRLYDGEVVRFLDEVMGLFGDVSAYERYCEQRLEDMLRWSNAVPLYRQRFAAARLFEGDRLHAERLADVQPLTKQDIRAHFTELQHPAPQAGRHENTSGGSTGEPVRFVQDKLFRSRAVADTILFGVLNGKQPGEREVKLWGSERDILEGSAGLREKLINRVYNRVLLNSFALSSATMRRYIDTINHVRPVLIWTYVDSIVELVRFAEREGRTLHNPAAIVCTAGTMYPEMRAELERHFPRSRIVNQYGSREVGQVATEADGVAGLWLMGHSNHVELVEIDSGAPITEPGRAGRVLVTTLNNRSLPLVRYDIGDIAEFAPRTAGEHRALARVYGRENAHFINSAGARIHGEFFTHLFYGRDWVETFQVAQTAIDRVEVRYVSNGRAVPDDLAAIRAGIQRVMGDSTQVSFQERSAIDRLNSGKYQFVRREFA